MISKYFQIDNFVISNIHAENMSYGRLIAKYIAYDPTITCIIQIFL